MHLPCPGYGNKFYHPATCMKYLCLNIYFMRPIITCLLGNITQLDTDAVVNAANSSLLGGGGVDGAIHRAGGPTVLEECMAIRQRQGGCSTGEAVYTSGGNLPARYIIHTVGPVWNGGKANEAVLLANCYRNSLAIANQLGLGSIAFPGISTGVYRFPKAQAATIAVQTVQGFMETENQSLQKVVFVCFDQKSFDLYKGLLPANR
jgi:O-acetyl-ADP-ribose deacetylase